MRTRRVEGGVCVRVRWLIDTVVKGQYEDQVDAIGCCGLGHDRVAEIQREISDAGCPMTGEIDSACQSVRPTRGNSIARRKLRGGVEKEVWTQKHRAHRAQPSLLFVIRGSVSSVLPCKSAALWLARGPGQPRFPSAGRGSRPRTVDEQLNGPGPDGSKPRAITNHPTPSHPLKHTALMPLSGLASAAG